MRWDHGFAPNPFHGVCTLATCKPDIRKQAVKGDLVLGTGSAKRGYQGRVIYFMEVDDVVTFDDYAASNEFSRKMPNMLGSYRQRFGDNIYHRAGPNEPWIQRDSCHTQADGEPDLANVIRDTSKTHKVLVGRNFTYWGEGAPYLPPELADLVHKFQNNTHNFSPERVEALLEWVSERNEHGRMGDPLEWKYSKYWTRGT